MKTTYFSCKEWQDDPSLFPVFVIRGKELFLISRDGKRKDVHKTLGVNNYRRRFIHGKKLYEISAGEAALLV